VDTKALVIQQIQDGEKLIEQLRREGFDVAAAFWVKYQGDESDSWYFTIVSSEPEKVGRHSAYRAIHAAIQKVPAPWGPWISQSELMLMRPNDALAAEVLALERRFGGGLIPSPPSPATALYIYPATSGSTDAAQQPPMAAIHEEALKAKDDLASGKTEQALRRVDQIIQMSGTQSVLFSDLKAKQ
jgi:hypothetical protein